MDAKLLLAGGRIGLPCAAVFAFALVLLEAPFTRAQEASAPATEQPSRVFDGRRWVPAQRLRPGRLLWDGVEVGIDGFALLWADGPVDFEALAELDVEVVATPSQVLGLHRIRSLHPEDGYALSRRLWEHVQGNGALRAVMPDVQIAHRLAEVNVPPNDPRYSGQWYFERIGLEDAWRLEDGDASVEIVVVDNGCDEDHPDLVAQMLPGRDVLDADDEPEFEAGVRGNEHGTACAGLIAAETDNDLGIAGACPECRVRCVRLLGEDPEVPLSADVAAFQFALDVDAAVVSNSWGFGEPIRVPGPLEAIIERVSTEGRGGLGALVVFAAGNDNRRVGDHELLAVQGVIGVGATNNFDETTTFTNFGASVDLVAPTGTITTDVAGAEGADPGDYTSLFGGTSSAAPVVSGVVGLLLSAAPETSADRIREVLRETAVQSIFARPGDDGHDDHYGFGLIQPRAALEALLGVPGDAGPAPIDGGAVAVDAGARDAAVNVDGGTEVSEAGCSCRSVDLSEGVGSSVCLFAVMVFLRRRRI